MTTNKTRVVVMTFVLSVIATLVCGGRLEERVHDVEIEIIDNSWSDTDPSGHTYRGYYSTSGTPIKVPKSNEKS